MPALSEVQARDTERAVRSRGLAALKRLAALLCLIDGSDLVDVVDNLEAGLADLDKAVASKGSNP